MATKNEIPWYQPGPEFKLTDAAKEFFLILVTTFIAGGLIAVIELLEQGSQLIPSEYLAYSGLIIAGLRALYTIVINYKNGL